MIGMKVNYNQNKIVIYLYNKPLNINNSEELNRDIKKISLKNLKNHYHHNIT